MPNKEVDYSNTVIYKICCKDELIKDIYVGHTINFLNRKIQHKISCLKNYNYKLYNFINENGGWDNWEMVKLQTVNCKDLLEARQKENEYYNLLNPTLNTIKPYVPYLTQFCNICNNSYNLKKYKIHLNTPKHLKNTNNNNNNNNIVINNFNKFSCKCCNYSTLIKCNFDKHCLTNKHLNLINGNTEEISVNLKEPNFKCNNCNKSYLTRGGFWKHNKKCLEKQVENKENVALESILTFIKQNQEFQEKMLEFIKKVE
jgi:hypothetical protein